MEAKEEPQVDYNSNNNVGKKLQKIEEYKTPVQSPKNSSLKIVVEAVSPPPRNSAKIKFEGIVAEKGDSSLLN